MKKDEKIAYLKTNHYSDWLKTKAEVDCGVSSQCSMFCICGKLCTGLHEMNCSKFKNKVDAETVKKLKHLIKK